MLFKLKEKHEQPNPTKLLKLILYFSFASITYLGRLVFSNLIVLKKLDNILDSIILFKLRSLKFIFFF